MIERLAGGIAMPNEKSETLNLGLATNDIHPKREVLSLLAGFDRLLRISQASCRGFPKHCCGDCVYLYEYWMF
jgi:hypothetical protein